MDKKVKIEKIYNLSSMQEGILFHSLLENDSSAYFEQMDISVDGKFNIDITEKSFNLLVERHDILRTNFVHQKVKKPQQVVFNKKEVKIQYEDISNFSYKNKIDYVENFKEQDRKKGFNLTKDILMRIAVLRLGTENYKLIWSFHHIILDGWSLGIIISEFFDIYKLLLNNDNNTLNVAPLYSDYIKWINSQNREEGLSYWSEYLQGVENKTVIPKLLNKNLNDSYIEKEVQFILEEEQVQALNKVALKNGVTINTMFQAMWGILLQKYNNLDDVVFGSVVSGRPAEVREIEKTVGLFINTVPVRVKGGRTPFSQLIKSIQESMIMAEKYNYFPLYEIQNNTVLKGDLLEHIVAFENYPIEKQKESLNGDKSLGFSITHMEMFERTNYNFNVIVQPSSHLNIFLRFNGSVYDENFVKGIEGHLKKIAKSIIRNPDINIEDIDILTEEEKQKLLYDFNNIDSDFHMNKTLHELFEEEVRKSPDNIAVVFEDKKLTYNELNKKANSLARVLRGKGVNRDCVVAIIVERSVDMIIGILGVLKAGGAYLPIDSEYPKERIKYMLDDSKTNILLTQTKLIEDLELKDNQYNIKADFNGEIIDLENKELYENEGENLLNINSLKDLAYVIYTSGSTGKPKGVMVEHKGIANLSVLFNENMGIKTEDNILQFASCSFDASVWEMFMSLLTGATSIIPTKETICDYVEIENFINKYNITVATFPPIYAMNLNPERIGNIRTLITAGSSSNLELVNRWKNKVNYINAYGPTEDTICTTICEYERNKNETNVISIGKPIQNKKVHILNNKNKLQPIGVVGELCIVGESLARGYLNKEDLTREKFITNPFNCEEKMYRSGDLARWLPDGNIEFLGRVDNQVKIRGFRIELGEIEHSLLSYESVRETIVTDREDRTGNKYLCAYIVADRELSINELRSYLSVKLPEYMIPSYFVQINEMPLTINGKIDKKALPSPKGNIIELFEYEAATTKLEEKLVTIWTEVLETKKIGINNNFFELGGHSLKATSLCSKINKELNIDVPIREIFKSPTIKEIAKYILNKEASICEGINKVVEKEYYEASSAQKRMYLLQQIDLQCTSYNIPKILEVEGSINIDKLEIAFCRLIERHEALRTSFKNIDGEIVQIIRNDIDFKVQHVDIIKAIEEMYLNKKELNSDYKLSAKIINEEIEKEINNFLKPFDLCKAPLLRGSVIRIEERKHLIMFDMHHIISDGVSIGILINEFIKLYEGNNLEALRLQYKDFSAWQNAFLKSEKIKKQEEYWLEKFSNEIPVLNMPTDFARPLVQSFEGDSISFKLDKELTSGLNKLGKETGSTMYMVLLSSINILLSKYSGQEDIVIGSPIAGRPHADLEKIMGMFVNTIAMRNYSEGNKNYEGFLMEVRENALRAYENQDYQFEELIEKLNIKRDIGRNPLFDVMFTMQNMDLSEIELKDLKFKTYATNSNVAKFDLTFTAFEISEEILIEVEYCKKLFKKETVERMVEHFNNILRAIVKNKSITLSEIDILSKEEKNKLLYEFNDTYTDYPRNETIQRLFEEQVEKTPNDIAVVFEEKTLKYKELNGRANKLARTLRERGVKQNSIVGIMVQRSFDMIIGIIAILKAGGAYLPIDQEYPEDRVKYMLEDSKAEILLTTEEHFNKVFFDGKIINLEDEECYADKNTNLDEINSSNNLAYVIYTSGSTGKPKGVMVEHTNVVRLIKNTNYISFKEDDRILQTGSLVFDASTFEVWGALLNGLRLYLVDNENLISVENFNNVIALNNISIVWLTASLFNKFSQENPDVFKNLRYLLVGGDVLSPKHINLVRNKCKDIKIINGYGPTENTTFSTTYPIEKSYEFNIPIGKPINNSTVYILDKYNKPQPIGVYGELCVSGDGVARGYLNNLELTAQKFIENPFVSKQRMYKTGDLARWLPDGNIEFVGRIDHQVKIRGFRIELGEIENQLSSYEKVKEAVVIDRKDKSGDKYLCAYVVCTAEVTIGELREYLSKILPEYMVPSYFIKLEKMLLTHNGKIDRNALPAPDGNITTGTKYEGARNELEENLVAIWSEVLGVKNIGINHNFFELGGHSLKATSLVSKIHKELNVEVPLKEIFKSSTIKEISEYIQNTEKNTYEEITIVEEKEYYEVSSAQKRMYMLQQLDLQGTSYNIPGVFEVSGKLNAQRLESAFNRLIERHETLRTSFENMDGQILQKISDHIEFKVDYVDIREILEELALDKKVLSVNTNYSEKVISEEIEKLIRRFIRAFDLSKSPLLRVGVIKVNEAKHIIMFDMHHIISDGVSMEILIKEFVQLYEGKNLYALRVQYKDFSSWQNNFLKSEKIKKQEKYWLENFNNEIPVLNMPNDFARLSMQSFEGDSISFEFNKELTRDLNKVAKETGSTMYMVLLSGVNILLSKYSGQEDIVIGSPIVGRPHADLERIIGMFVNTLAMRNNPKGSKHYREFLKEVKENALKAYENQDYQFEELVDKLNIRRDISRNPLFDVMVTMQNMDSSEIELEDLNFVTYKNKNKVAKFDLSFTAVEIGEVILVDIEYCTKLFKRETIERIAEHFKNILKAVVRNTNIRLSEIDMLSEDEKNKLLYEFNDTYADYPKDKTIHQLFEEQVEKTPDKVAVVFEEKKLTYRELNEKANRLARTLREKGVKQNSIVGIMLERSLEMIVGIMAILKAGGAYLPIDSEYPEDRIQYMLQDSKSNILLTQSKLDKKASFYGQNINLDDEKQYSYNGQNLESITTAQGLAYVIYTSGSTGKPKGVMIEHVQANNFIQGVIKKINLRSYESILCITTISFDIFVLETLTPLTIGLKVVITKETEDVDGDILSDCIIKNEVKVMQTTPSRLQLLMENHRFKNTLTNLNMLLIGGDSLNLDLLKRLKQYNSMKIYNMYGPTETTVWSAIKELTNESEITIGTPIQNTNIQIINKHKQLQPIGIIGEMCIGGDGVSRGYLNKPKLTAEKFIENPFIPGEMIYKTGDLARWLPDGNIEFLGRIDHQVKIRGFRIELGEIENQLLNYESVKESVVIDRKDKNGDKYLCAYVVCTEKVTVNELREHLLKNLSQYMVPSYFIQLDKLPLTYNGKIDRKSLPEPDGNILVGTEYEAPTNKLEEKLVEIWKEVLGVDNIGVNDDFFELGGHSLKSIILIKLIYKELKVELSIKDFYKSPRIKHIAKYIINMGKQKVISLDNPIMLLNNKNKKNIFAFPPVSGYGIAFNELARELDKCSIYAFDFIEAEDRIEQYIRLIKTVQNNGPYVLVGYSVGGNLAFEVARALELEGNKVSDIIMIDSISRYTTEKIDIDESMKVMLVEVEKYLKAEAPYMIEHIKGDIANKMKKYMQLLNEGMNKETIKSNIHVITSDSNNYSDDYDKWKNITKGDFKIYKGLGLHNDMLKTSCVVQNGKILDGILRNLPII